MGALEDGYRLRQERGVYTVYMKLSKDKARELEALPVHTVESELAARAAEAGQAGPRAPSAPGGRRPVLPQARPTRRRQRGIFHRAREPQRLAVRPPVLLKEEEARHRQQRLLARPAALPCPRPLSSQEEASRAADRRESDSPGIQRSPQRWRSTSTRRRATSTSGPGAPRAWQPAGRARAARTEWRSTAKSRRWSRTTAT